MNTGGGDAAGYTVDSEAGGGNIFEGDLPADFHVQRSVLDGVLRIVKRKMNGDQISFGLLMVA